MRLDQQLVATRVVEEYTNLPPVKYPKPPLPQVETDFVTVNVVKVTVLTPDAELQKEPPSPTL